eukprot:14528797-Alexandrium_andersonii.AAC.1
MCIRDRGGPASAGAPPAGPPESRDDGVSDAEPAELEQNTEDVDEEMFFLLDIMACDPRRGRAVRVFGRANPLERLWTLPERSSRQAQLPGRCGPRWRRSSPRRGWQPLQPATR